MTERAGRRASTGRRQPQAAPRAMAVTRIGHRRTRLATDNPTVAQFHVVGPAISRAQADTLLGRERQQGSALRAGCCRRRFPGGGVRGDSSVSSAGVTNREAGLLERTRELVPLLRENAQRTEEGRRVVDENIEALTDAGVFRMTVGRHFGGYESSLQTQYDVLAAIASGCPSTGWVATILTAMLWNAGCSPTRLRTKSSPTRACALRRCSLRVERRVRWTAASSSPGDGRSTPAVCIHSGQS